MVSTKENGGHLPAQRVAREMLKARKPFLFDDTVRQVIQELDSAPTLLEQVKNLAKTVSRQLIGKNRPTAESAMELGECLRRCGIPWCIGWWLLYAFGHFEAFIGVTMCLVNLIVDLGRIDELPEIWELVIAAHELCVSTPFDKDPASARIHCLNSGDIVVEATSLPADMSQRSLLDFVSRQVAKRHFANVDRYRPYLDFAYSQWTKLEFEPEIRAAMIVAGSDALPLAGKEEIVRVLLARAFQMKAPAYVDRFRIYPLRAYKEEPIYHQVTIPEDSNSSEDIIDVLAPEGTFTVDERLKESVSLLRAHGMLSNVGYCTNATEF